MRSPKPGASLFSGGSRARFAAFAIKVTCGLLTMTALACATVRSPGVESLHRDRLLLHLEDARFDGGRLTGRILLGVTSGTGATIEPDAWPVAGLYVLSVKRCGEPTELPRFAQNCFGRLGPAPESAAPVRLKPGSWYEHDVDVQLTDREPAPECVLVDALVPLNRTGGPGSQLRFAIQARRNGQVRLIWPVDRRTPERTEVLRAGTSFEREFSHEVSIEPERPSRMDGAAFRELRTIRTSSLPHAPHRHSDSRAPSEPN